MVKKVILYTTPLCPQCERTKRFLKEKGIKYTVVDVFKDQKKAEEIFERSGKKVVPIIEIGENLIVGFNKKIIEKSLE
ncbi:glutaredoxin family protein [Patescibacteria group bacterium]|nr:glutaredoxin family protein [Patescibacteria group bacterium]